MTLGKEELLSRLRGVRVRKHAPYCDMFTPGAPECSCGKQDEEIAIARELTARYGRFWQRKDA